ncbi:MAG: phosphoribosylanthranilate isomerase [Bryobacteraceae bacterium]|jgi:phosphoribosylanthranilate isomerase
MMVKICGITNRMDALVAIEGGAAALGFNFYPSSPRYIPPDEAAEIAAGLPAEIWKVGVFVDESPESVLRTAGRVGLDIVQLHGDELREQYPMGIRVWKAFRVTPGQIVAPASFPAAGAEAVLLDGPASGQTFDWACAPHGIGKLILAGGLDAGNVRAAIKQVHPWGVDACSRIEVSPGRKDHFKLAAFLKAALAASQ